MFNIGTEELILILLVSLLLFGAKRIPEIARAMGKGMADFRDALSGMEREIKGETPAARPPTTLSGFLAAPKESVPRSGTAAAEAEAPSTAPESSAPVPSAAGAAAATDSGGASVFGAPEAPGGLSAGLPPAPPGPSTTPLAG